jgi:hypothetical protein
MSNATRLRALASKCDELAEAASTKAERDKQRMLAQSYRRMAEREDWLEQQSLPPS